MSTITAARLGSAPLTLDWSGLSRVPGSSPSEQFGLRLDREAVARAWETLRARFDADEVGFYHAPLKPELHQGEACVQLAQKLLIQTTFSDVLFLGIGGSSLGPLSALQSLAPSKPGRGLRFHFMENPDALEWNSTMRALRPESTLVCIVTKSGTTFETLAQAMIALEWTGKQRWHSHVVAITDPTKGDLRAFAQAQNIHSLPIAPSIGGRFSVFSPVGLFALALQGHSVADFLKGALQVRDAIEKAPLEKNAIFNLSVELLKHWPRRSVHVCMPYASPLRAIGDWFVQLWGESLGKDGKGFTPLAALGATDQHSILQLLRDGPDDKVTWFITVDQVGDPAPIPRTLSGVDLARFPAFQLLQGHSLNTLLTTEYRATSLVLSKRGRPQLTIQLDRLDERAMGALYFTFSVLVAMTGTLWGVNAFDQPGVEEGKVYIRESLQQQAREILQKEMDDENSPVARLRRERPSLDWDPEG